MIKLWHRVEERIGHVDLRGEHTLGRQPGVERLVPFESASANNLQIRCDESTNWWKIFLLKVWQWNCNKQRKKAALPHCYSVSCSSGMVKAQPVRTLLTESICDDWYCQVKYFQLTGNDVGLSEWTMYIHCSWTRMFNVSTKTRHILTCKLKYS